MAGLSVEYSKEEKIEADLRKIDKEYSKINWEYLSKEKKIENVVKLSSAVWQVHPFREGNTRTISVFIFFLMKKLNLELNNQFLAEHERMQQVVDDLYLLNQENRIKGLCNRAQFRWPNADSSSILYVPERQLNDGNYDLKEVLLKELKESVSSFSVPLFPKTQKVSLQFCKSDFNPLIRAADIVANTVYSVYREDSDYSKDITKDFVSVIFLP